MTNPLPPNTVTKFAIGDIIRDVDYDDEYYIITEIGTDMHNNIVYEVADFNDFSRRLYPKDCEFERYFEVAS